MNQSIEFSFIGLSKSNEVKGILNKVSSTLGIYSDILEDSANLLNKLYENKFGLIVLHTDIGMEKLKSTLVLLGNDEIARYIPIIIISDLDDIETLSLDVQDDKVISILTYKNYRYQLGTLLKFLASTDGYEADVIEETDNGSQSLIDPLTDVLKWSGVNGVFSSLVSDFNDNARPFSFIMFGIDDLKSINEVHGNDIGDEVLVSVSSIAQQNIRRYDTVLRFDTDTFGVFLSGANLEIAKTKAESFRYEMQVKGHGFDKIKTTASFSVLEYKEGNTLEELSSISQSLVLRAKEEDGNRVVCS